MSDIEYSAPMESSRYFDTSTFRNTIHACNIAVHNHFSNLIFNGDGTRLVYSSTKQAFRKRMEQKKGSSNLDLPFLSYRIANGGLKNEVSRKWWNHIGNIRGVYVSELERNIRFTPVTIEYEATLFLHKDIDAMFALSELFWDDSNETQLEPLVIISEQELSLPASLGYNLNTYSQYEEDEWLKSSKMIAMQVNMKVETVLIKDKAAATMPTKMVLDFGWTTGVIADASATDSYEAVIDHLNETVDWGFSED